MSIVIIGAGPVGLMMAIKLHKTIPTAVIEKRKSFMREQIIIIDKNFYNDLPKRVQDELFGIENPGCFILPPAQDWEGICYLSRKDFDVLPYASIRIDLLQSALLTEAKRVGVQYYSPGADEETLDYKITPPYVYVKKQRIRFRVLIGADGKTSFVREHILHSPLLRGAFTYPVKNVEDADALFSPSRQQIGVHLTADPNEDTTTYIADTVALKKPKQRFKDYVVLVNFTFDHRASRIRKAPNLMVQRFARWRGNQQRFRFLFSQKSEGRFAMRLTETELQHFDQRKNKDKLPMWLVKKIKGLLQLIYLIKPQYVHIDHEKSKLLEIELTKSKIYAAKTAGDTLTVLVGDSAYTTHFFTGNGANYGWRAGKFLINLLKQKMTDTAIIDQYTNYVDNILADRSARQSMVDVWFSQKDIARLCAKLSKGQLLQLATMYRMPLPERLSKTEMCQVLSHHLLDHEYQLFRNKYRNCEGGLLYAEDDIFWARAFKMFPFIGPLNKFICDKRTQRGEHIPIQEYHRALNNEHDWRQFQKMHDKFGKLTWENNRSMYWFDFLDIFPNLVDDVSGFETLNAASEATQRIYDMYDPPLLEQLVRLIWHKLS